MNDLLSRVAPALEAMLRDGVSVLVGSRDAALRPNLVRAIGASPKMDDGTLTVYLWQRQAAQVLENIRATGHVAVVYSVPSTHRSIQLKSRQARLRPAGAGDRPAIEGYLAAILCMIQSIGFPEPMVKALYAHAPDELVAVQFVPELGYDQTPGPRAGQPL